MKDIRLKRINSEMQEVLAQTIQQELTDERLNGAIVSVLKVAVDDDLEHAKINISIFGKNEEEAFHAILSSVPFLRKSVARKMQLRIVPELHFVLDKGIEYASKMDALFQKIKKD